MQLEPTSERLIEEFYLDSPQHYLIYLFHMATYNFALPFVQGRKVLDYGCGSGYGTHHVAAACETIVGVDIAAEAVSYADSRYKAKNLSYRRIEEAGRAALPFQDGAFDVVLSFQVIEHIADVHAYLKEIDRVLRPGGIFLCATPDRSTRLFPGQKPWNMWHVHEYGAEELTSVLRLHFPECAMYGMGGKPEVLDIELRRTQRLKWLTLPFTVPFMPEYLRVRALRFLKSFAEEPSRKRIDDGCQPNFNFSEEDLRIAHDVRPSVNLIAVGSKSE